ncbi:MAG: hypothetical protein OXN26_00200 [Gammaproteobacteria bacterium]|nr:hypothetical protein [Gammaproteobacteria bacterium]
MFASIRRIADFLLGAEPSLLGAWQRVGDNFSGCRIVVEQTEDGLQGRLVYVPDRMQNAGWSVGEIKWGRIVRTFGAAYLLQDKQKLFDTRRQAVAGSASCEARLRFVNNNEITVVPRALDQGSFSRWRRVNASGQSHPHHH